MKTTKNLKEVKIGNTFEIADIEWIKFADKDGNTIAVSKNLLFNSVFGTNNNLSTSTIKSRLEREVLPKIEEAIGKENIVEHEVDLLSLDGSEKWGKDKCKISIPTFDFYRHNVKVFDKHNPNQWWWLATPDTTSDHFGDAWNVCVSSCGYFDDSDSSYYNYGVRPFIVFVSSISVSCEE